MQTTTSPSPTPISTLTEPPRTEWISTSEFSRRWGRSYSTVMDMVHEGTLLAFGFRLHSVTYTDRRGRTGRWWIEVPIEMK